MITQCPDCRRVKQTERIVADEAHAEPADAVRVLVPCGECGPKSKHTWPVYFDAGRNKIPLTP